MTANTVQTWRVPLLQKTSLPIRKLGLFALAHVPLGLLMHQFNAIATVHAIVTFLIGCGWAIYGRRPERVAYVAAYITGAEVLWRMASADVFWEFGKYAVAGIFLLALLRTGKLQHFALPLLYLGLLTPSTVQTIQDLRWAEARSQISFNLSGPFALAMSCWFFANVRLSLKQLQRLFLVLIAPIAGIATIALYGTVAASEIHFTTQSNFETSGGFGPNQVSAVLGLGALLTFLILLTYQGKKAGVKLCLFCGLALFAIQSALTFSRGGLYNAAGAGAVASMLFLSKTKFKLRVLAVAVLVLIIAHYVVLPSLDDYTGGALSERFSSLNLTGRDRLIRGDLQAWEENPVFGVGPGRARFSRGEFYREGVAAHTEFSRLLAEHGMWGLAALFTLLFMAIKNFRQARSGVHKALLTAATAWSLLFMTNAAMRLVAPSFVFGLASVTLLRQRKILQWTTGPYPSHQGQVAVKQIGAVNPAFTQRAPGRLSSAYE
jgi:hypothetical protein